MSLSTLVRRAVDSARPIDSRGGNPVEEQLEPVRGLRKQFAGLRNRNISRLSSTAGDRGRVRSLASAVAGQQERTGTNAATTLQESLRISKARTGIVNRGEAAVENQNLKDRLTEVRSGLARRAQLVGATGRAANIRQGVSTNVAAAKAFSDASRAGTIGGILGGGAALLKGNKSRTGKIFDFGKKGPGL